MALFTAFAALALTYFIFLRRSSVTEAPPTDDPLPAPELEVSPCHKYGPVHLCKVHNVLYQVRWFFVPVVYFVSNLGNVIFSVQSSSLAALQAALWGSATGTSVFVLTASTAHAFMPTLVGLPACMLCKLPIPVQGARAVPN